MLLRAGSVLAGLFVAVLLVEAALWLFQIEPARIRTKLLLIKADSKPMLTYGCYSSNPNGEFRALPDTSEGRWILINNMMKIRELPLEELSQTPWCVEYRNSQLGIRDRDYSVKPPPGVLRIPVFGDSFVLGEGVQIEKTLTRQTLQHLGPEKFELMNFGSSGWNTRQELQALETNIPQLHAKRAIVVFTANDVEITHELESRQEFINDLINIRDEHLEQHEAEAWYNGPSRLVRFVGSNLEMRRIGNETIQWYKDMYDERYNQANLLRFNSFLQRMGSRTDCQVAYVLYPLMEGLEGTYPLADVHAKVAQMAKAAGMPVLDLAPAFQGQKTSDLWVHDSDHHPNGKGHAIAAKALADWLKTLPGFLDLPPVPAAAPPVAPSADDSVPPAADDEEETLPPAGN
ncbi:MAG: SGNH/GDSL hydrolase family protein [Pirellulales bacterium]|nr:SGNH/GDSL hydrolase family protein [Pirellulales bacterium]